MLSVTVQLLGVGLYILGLVFFTPSRATEWCTNWIDEMYKKDKCHLVFVLIGMVLAVVLWPITQIAYAVRNEWTDKNTPSN